MKIIFFFLLFGYSLFYSQTNIQIDSLKRYDYEKLKEKFYDYNYDGKHEKSKIIAKYYLSKAKQEKNDLQIAEGYAFMYVNENQENALKYVDSLAQLTKNIKENGYPTRIYLLRANIYFKFNNQQKALNNYIIGLKYAKQQNNKRQIALAETNIAYLNSFIGKDSEAAKVLQHYLDTADYLTENELEKIRLNLADCYIEINNLNSAKVLINRGLNIFKNKDEYRYYQYLGLSGFYNLKLKKYQNAINDLLQCNKYFFTTDDKRNQNYNLLYLGKSYAGLHNKEKAVKYFSKLDSLVLKTNYIFLELGDAYTYLIDYYKEKNDKEKQLYYVDRYLKIDEMLDSQFKYVSRELPRRYDTPQLIQEKENITNELKYRKKFFYSSLVILLLILLVFIYLYYKSKKTEKKHREIAHNLLQSVHENKTQKQTTPKEVSLENNMQQDEKITKTISEDVIQAILKGLEIFEAKEQFLNKGITLGSLAKKMKTNSKYLSEIINTHKRKNFVAYLNDLRIDYAIKRLANDKKFRSYKISSIAEELGYNTEQSFTLAFKKRTGTPLSIYLKEIEETVTPID